MRRKRFQRGSLQTRKHGSPEGLAGSVVGWRSEAIEGARPLHRNYEGQAEAMMMQLLQPLNVEAGHRQAPAFTFEQYIEKVFLPVHRQKWKESTRSTSEPDIKRYLIPAFGRRLLHTIKRDQIQAFLDGMAGKLSASVVGHLRWHLNAIFKLAVSDGVVDLNPAAGLFIRRANHRRPRWSCRKTRCASLSLGWMFALDWPFAWPYLTE